MGRREEKRAAVRRKILDVCAELFRTKGFDETSVDEITRGAEISRQTFFNYFTGKEAVLTELGLEWLRSQAAAPRAGMQAIATGTARHKSVLEGTRAAIAAQAAAIEKERIFMKLVITRSNLFSPAPPTDMDGVKERRTDHAREIFKAVAGIIRAGQVTGEIRKEIDPLQAAEVYVSAMIMTVRMWLTGYWGTADSLEQRMLAAADLLAEGLKARRLPRKSRATTSEK